MLPWVLALCVPCIAWGRPNILFLFSDDHGEQAISAYGSRLIRTPHLDRLAARGVRFENSFVTNSICTPSRATLLTGQYSHVNGVPVFNRFDGSRDHVAKRLRAGGYHTGMVGKWHLGCDPTGFDRWIVLPGQGAYRDPKMLVSGHELTIRGHTTEITGELGVEWIATRPKDKPFFLMLHHKAPHRPWQPDERNKALYRGRTFPEPPTLFDTFATRPAALPENRQTIARDLMPADLKEKPPAGLRGDDLVRWKYQRYLQDYLACVQGVDDSVGRLIGYLETSGLLENTIILYSSDNGWYLGEFGMYDKRFMYEPGLRVPLMACGPGIKAGVVVDELVANIDLAPTFLDLAGLPIPESMQGRSLAPLLRGESPAGWRQSLYYRYYHSPGHHNTAAHCGVRTATHKLIHYGRKGVYEMYDLVKDPLEQHNLLHSGEEARRPEVAAWFAGLKEELERLQKSSGDDGRYEDPATWPEGGVEGGFGARKSLGVVGHEAAIAASADPAR